MILALWRHNVLKSLDWLSLTAQTLSLKNSLKMTTNKTAKISIVEKNEVTVTKAPAGEASPEKSDAERDEIRQTARSKLIRVSFAKL